MTAGYRPSRFSVIYDSRCSRARGQVLGRVSANDVGQNRILAQENGFNLYQGWVDGSDE